MLYRYLPIEERLHSAELGHYIAYGISVLNLHGNEICRISDVSVCYSSVNALCEVCTAQELHPIHLRDAVEDFLAES